MKRTWTIFLALITVLTYLPGAVVCEDTLVGFHTVREPYQFQAADERFDGAFQEHTRDILAQALRLIDKNERQGASLDQRWYAGRRFGKHLQAILESREVRFYGGREADVLPAVANEYVSIAPLEPDQDSGEVRLFRAFRDATTSDVIIVGQNGKEVALKTVIRLVYLLKFMDPERGMTADASLGSFLQKIRVYFSSVPARQEFVSFFERHRISDPDVVLVGFQGDARAVLSQAGVGEPERYSSDSLRVNWYPSVHGKKILLVSLNGNRIFASRAGELIHAMLEAFRSPPRALVFFGSAGAIDSAELIGHVVAPTVVTADAYPSSNPHAGKLAHIVNNRATAIVPVKSAHVSVESILAETMEWAMISRQRRIMTVDQELFHVINALNSSLHRNEIQLFVGMLVTDNVAVAPASHELTLQHAEDVIAQTTALRREFLAVVLAEAGILSQALPDECHQRLFNNQPHTTSGDAMRVLESMQWSGCRA